MRHKRRSAAFPHFDAAFFWTIFADIGATPKREEDMTLHELANGAPPKPVTGKRSKSVNQFCSDHCVSRSFAYSEIRRGKLKVRKFGRATRITEDDEAAYLELAAA
jgi:hypothetical protein